MRNWLRRLRGAIGIGVVWGAVWGFVGGIPRWIFGVNTDAPLGLVFGVLGFLAGFTFAVVVIVAAGPRRRFEELSVPRFAAWGAAGGLLLSAIFGKAASLSAGDFAVVAPTIAAACATSAAGSLAVARRAWMRAFPRGFEKRELQEGPE